MVRPVADRLLMRILSVSIVMVLVGCGPKSKNTASNLSIDTPKLDIGPQDVVTQTVYQRESRKIAASGGSLRFYLGDITRGCVLVSVVDRSGEPLIDRKEMRSGDIVRAKVDMHDYVFSLDRLVNLLTGEDYATLSVMRAEKWNQVAIERLLNTIETSGLIFIRNGQEHDGREIAMLFRQKLSFLDQKNPTIDEFIDNVASKSMTTGEPYAVKLANGKTIQLSEWLRSRVPGSSEKPCQGSTNSVDEAAVTTETR